jgi:hypothetical protein
MDHPTAPPTAVLRCRECGAENLRDAVHCWLCMRHDWRDEDIDELPPFPIWLGVLRAATIVLFLAALGVILIPRVPIAAIVVLAILVPSLLVIEIQALRGQRWGTPVSARDRVVTSLKCLAVLVPLTLFATLSTLVLRVGGFLGARIAGGP